MLLQLREQGNTNTDGGGRHLKWTFLPMFSKTLGVTSSLWKYVTDKNALSLYNIKALEQPVKIGW